MKEINRFFVKVFFLTLLTYPTKFQMKSGCLLELAKKDLILPNKKQLIRVAESGSTKFNVCVACLRLLICSNFFDKLRQQL